MLPTTILAEMAAGQSWPVVCLDLTEWVIFLTDTSKLKKVFRLYVAIWNKATLKKD